MKDEIAKCFICGKDVPDYQPEYCCSGVSCGVVVCGCYGLPIEPALCSAECTEKLFGKKIDEN